MKHGSFSDINTTYPAAALSFLSQQERLITVLISCLFVLDIKLASLF